MGTAADSDFLLGMAAASRERDAAARARLSDAQLRTQLLCVDAARPLHVDVGFGVIAELKKLSPAEGKLDDGLDSPAEQASAYIEGGAAALSVLTEPERFAGSLDDLQAVVAVAGATPVMRKDFLVSRYQVREARLAGASGVLLIAAMLDADQLEAMLAATLELDMFALVEVFDEADLERCLPVLARAGDAVTDGRCRYLLGVNCRDLRTLQVDFSHFTRMAPLLPADIPLVAESGLTEPAQAAELAALGYRIALVGTALMRSGEPASAIAAIRKSGGAASCT
ncbi:MAG: indole-3-glycerol-phosphate synthase [Gammaproteobacteria bacterium]|nr:indole-3-glycerol-phosphate synthase [Gammaproteobacteria bacterium]